MHDIERRKSNAALLSIISGSTLVVVKLSVGLSIGAVSVISEAIHSGVDLLAAVIAYVSVREASKPADARHPFGHGKIENLSGAVEALLIFVAAAWIIYEAGKKLIVPSALESASLGIIVMFVSTVMNLIVSHFLFKVGRETESIALQADAWHLRTDVYTSAGVMAGLVLVQSGRIYFPQYNLEWIDPVFALLVAVLIIKAAFTLTVKAAGDLLDANLPKEESWIRTLLESERPVIRGYHYLRTRKSGSMRFVEFHIQVDSEMTVNDSHNFARKLSQMIKDQLPKATVTIHIEPCTGQCDDKCLSGCLLDETERAGIKSGISC